MIFEGSDAIEQSSVSSTSDIFNVDISTSPPRGQDLTLTIPSVVTSNRTTSTLVLCTLNTAVIRNVKVDSPTKPKLSMSAKATLPYASRRNTTSLNAINSPGKGGKTQFEDLRGLETHLQRNQELKEERDLYMDALYKEREEIEWIDYLSACKIQAIYRGFNVRGRSEEYQYYGRSPPRSPKRKSNETYFLSSTPTHTFRNEIVDELCSYASTLKLAQIRGLTLEPRGKANRRKQKMQISALARVVKFFRMICARSNALRDMRELLIEKKKKMANRIIKCFRLIFIKKFRVKAMMLKKHEKATLIQSTLRRHQAFHRVRKLRRDFHRSKREREHGIIIQRNFKASHERFMLRTEAARDSIALEVSNIIFDHMFNCILDIAIEDAKREICMDEIALFSTNTSLENLLGDILADEAEKAGQIQIAEQLAELKKIRKEMEDERIALEKEQQRLQEEEALLTKQHSLDKEIEQSNDQHDTELSSITERNDYKGRSTRRYRVDWYSTKMFGSLEDSNIKYFKINECIKSMDEGATLFDAGHYRDALQEYEFVWNTLSESLNEEFDVSSNTLFDRIVSVAVVSDNPKETTSIIAQLSTFIGDCLYEQCKYDEAKTYYILSGKLRDESHSPNHPLVSEIKVKIGFVYLAKAQFLDADNAFKTAESYLEVSQELLAKSSSLLAEYLANTEPGEEQNKILESSFKLQAEIDLVQSVLVQALTGHCKLCRYWGRYDQSLALTYRAIEASNTLFSSRNERDEFLLVDVLTNRASLYRIAGLYNDSLRTYKEALNACILTIGENHPMTASTTIRLAYASCSVNDFDSALYLIDRAITVQRNLKQSQFFSNGGLDIAQSLHCKGVVYMKLARYEESQPLLELAYQMRTDILSDSHPCVAHTICAMADLGCEKGEFQESLQNYDVTLDKQKGSLTLLPFFGGEKSDTGNCADSTVIGTHFYLSLTMFKKARCLEQYGSYKQALSLYEIVLSNRREYHKLQNSMLERKSDRHDNAEAISNDNLLDTMEIEFVRTHISSVLVRLGRIQEGQELGLEAHKTLLLLAGRKQQCSEPKHLYIAESLLVLGRIMSIKGIWTDADELLSKACRMKEDILGFGHPDIAIILRHMSINMLGPGYYNQAKEFCNQSIQIIASKFAKNASPMSFCIYNKGLILRDIGQVADAAAHFHNALTYARHFFTDESPHYALAQLALGDCQRLQFQLDDATQSIKTAIATLNDHFGKDHVCTIEAIRNLSLLQTDQGNYEDAVSLLQDHCYPALSKSIGEKSPSAVYTRALIGLNYKRSYEKYVRDHNGDADQQELKMLEMGENFIDDALDFFDTFLKGPLDTEHPWVRVLGGFIVDSTSRASTARSELMLRRESMSNTNADDAMSRVFSRPTTQQSEYNLLEIELSKTLPSRPTTTQTARELLLTEAEILTSRPNTRSEEKKI